MKKRVDVYLVLLLVWFTLDLTGLSVNNFTIVRGTGVLGVNGILWSVYSILLLIYFFGEKSANKLLLVYLVFWTMIEYFKEWHLIMKQFIFLEETQNNVAFFPSIYHLILEGFIIISLMLLVKYMFFQKNKKYNKFIIIEKKEEIEEVLSLE